MESEKYTRQIIFFFTTNHLLYLINRKLLMISSKNLRYLCLVQIIATVFLLSIILYSLFYALLPDILSTIVGVFQELLTIPSLLFTVVAFGVSFIQLVFKQNKSRLNVILFVLSTVTIMGIVIATLAEYM